MLTPLRGSKSVIAQVADSRWEVGCIEQMIVVWFSKHVSIPKLREPDFSLNGFTSTEK